MFNSSINSVNRVYVMSLMLVCLCASCLFGQVSIDFKKLESSTQHSTLHPSLTSAQIYSISSAHLRSALNTKSMEIAIGGELNLRLQLTEMQILSPDYQAYVYTSSKESIRAGFDTESVSVFSGIIESNSSSKVSLTLSAKGIEGMIFDGTTSYFIEYAKTEQSESEIEHLLYTADDVSDKNIHCLVNEVGTLVHKATKKTTQTTGSCIEVSLAIAVDHDYYQIYNQDISTVIARSIAVMGAAALDYDSQFDNSITFKIVEHYISTCELCDPWGENKDAVVLLENFSHWAEEDGFSSDYDLGQLWTGGDLQGNQSSSVIGYAFKGSVCTNKKYHILEDYSESLWKLRLLASHEIGHNFNCSHDPVGSPTIMSPTVSNTSTWSTNSISAVNSFIADLTCLRNCSTPSCEPISDLTIIDFSTSEIILAWSSASPVNVKLINTSSGEILHETVTNDNELHIPGSFSNCEALKLEIQADCGLELSETIGIPLGSPHDLLVDILDIKTINCDPGLISAYDIQLVVNHNGMIGEPFFVDIDGQTTQFRFNSSPQTLVIDRAQILMPQQSQDLQIFSITNSELYCLTEQTLYSIPNQYCDLHILEDFNDCALPFNWTMTTSNTTYFPFEYAWQFNDNSRKILNYGKADNINSEKTISGNCMAYFDDDINTNPDFTGTLVLYSDVYDVTQYTNVKVSFAYLFHDFSDIKGSNNSFFSLQIWSNNTWIEVLRDDRSPCEWSDIWRPECMDIFSIDVDSYVQDQLQCRFIYSDSNEGDWTGMAALDNFVISGQRALTFGCTNASSINYNPLADYDDGSCYSCTNDIQDGQETGIDCGGPECQACPIPCAIPSESITAISKDSVYTDIDEILISASIDQLNIGLKPGKSAVFLSGFEITNGSTLSTEIRPCLHED